MKIPLRMLWYIVWVFQTEYLRANAAQRRRFTRHASRRFARLLGLHKGSFIVSKLWQKGARLVGTSSELRMDAQFPQWLRAISGLDESDTLRLWTQRRYEGGPKIVVLGMGSLGDILQITPVLRALREKFPSGEICLLHRSPMARMVLQGNQNVDSVDIARAYDCEQIKQAVRDEGAADLVVEIESISYILSYTPAPSALRHPQFQSAMPETFLAEALAVQALWKRHPSISPRREAKFVWPEEWKSYQYLDVIGATGKLPIDRYSALDFLTAPEDEVAIDRLRPKKPYVTIQSGVDSLVTHLSRASGQRPTKLLPAATWDAAVRLLQATDLAVIQLGTKDDERIEAADADLRGSTTLREVAVLLRDAVCHVGTEGGLVHLARAMNVRSVVAFGPTSSAFLGYPRNVNLVASACNSCWWTTKDWYIDCPRGFVEPLCMSAYTADMIVDAALGIFRGDDSGQRKG